MTLNIIWGGVRVCDKKRKSKPQQNWSESDIEILKNMYEHKIEVQRIARRLKRSEASVHAMAIRLGITKNNKFTDEEMQYIRDNYKTESVEDIALEIDRPQRSIVKKIKEIRESE